MECEGQARQGCVHFGSLSFAASMVGVIATAILYVLVWNPVAGPFDFRPVAVLIVICFAFVFAVPVGVVLGIPLLFLSAPLLRRYVVSGTLAFTVIGLFAGLALQMYFNEGKGLFLPDDAVVFGSVIGGLHPLVFGLTEPLPRRRLAAAFALSALLVSAGYFAFRDDEQVRAAWSNGSNATSP